MQPEITEYDYGKRQYDPLIARWLQIDPLTEISRRWSPYSYTQNNPIRNVDIDGMLTYDWNSGTYKDDKGNGVSNEDAVSQLQDMGTTIYTAPAEEDEQQTQTTPGQGIANDAESALKNNPHDWDYNKQKDNYGPGTDKCNKFVYDMLRKAGIDPGTPNGNFLKRIFGAGSPPTAQQWADASYDIPHWRVLKPGEKPQPGDIVAQKIHYTVATGHVGIVVGDKQTISVALAGGPGSGEILKKNDFGFRDSSDKNPLGHQSDCVFRRYVP